MKTPIRFVRNEHNPRWDDRPDLNWLNREVRFDALAQDRRIVCRIKRRSFVQAFGPLEDHRVFETFRQHRSAFESAAVRAIGRARYASDLELESPNAVSVLLTEDDIQRSMQADDTVNSSVYPAEDY
jgi:hypothetical protein